jgi:hypothetical protein
MPLKPLSKVAVTNPKCFSVWKELNARKAVVFVHPINNKSAVYFDERLPMPAFDWPHETGRTASK